MAYSGRPLSPGGRRISNIGRLSDTTLIDPPYQSSRHSMYASPRGATGGVIPISTETYINLPSLRDTRHSDRVDAYTGRPRRASVAEPQRMSSSTSALPIRSSGRPAVVQNEIMRPSSPLRPSRDRDMYITPASSQEHRSGQHKKLYSIDDGTAKLVADVRESGDRHHRQKDSSERGTYRTSGTDRDRGRRSYHISSSGKSREKDIDSDDAFSYTDAAGMYRDTEPRYARQRRGSLDRGAVTRERPVSMIDVEPRRSTKESGPPPSTRGWDKIHRSHRDQPRDVGTSPSRARTHADGAYADPRDQYYVPQRTNSADRRGPTVHQDRYSDHDYDDRRELRRSERKNSISRGDRPDRSIERRGFGIRSDSRGGNPYRSSDESFDNTRYRDSGYSEARHREATHAESAHYQDDRRAEPERKDREYVERQQGDEHTRRGDREHREIRRDREYDVDKEREQERIRQLEPPSERERERAHRHHDSRDHDSARKEPTGRNSMDSNDKPSFVSTVAGGLATAAAAVGLGGALGRSDKRDKEDDRDARKEARSDPREKDDRSRRESADRERPRDKDDRSRRESADGERPRDKSDRSRRLSADRERPRERDADRGLGFAYESSKERSAPTARPDRDDDRPHNPPSGSSATRDVERSHDERPVEMPKPAVDPDEDYRRRMEQLSRELGGSEDHRSSDSDPDRARRRQEREQRLRDRKSHRESINSSDGRGSSMPDPQQYMRRPHDDEQSVMTSTTTGTSSDLTRRQSSILDRPMTDEPAQIIDNSLSTGRENRVRIVDPPTEEEERRPKGILKKPTEKFPENSDNIREGVAPLKDVTKKGIPPGAKWTKIDRRLVNPAALEAAGERYEERMDHVIVLRVLTKEDIQKLADRTKEIRDKQYQEERKARRHRHERDEYSEDDSADEFKKKAPKMLGAPSTVSGVSSEGSRDREPRRERERERERDRDKDRDSDLEYSGGGKSSRRDDSRY